jgi:hypothetical protein
MSCRLATWLTVFAAIAAWILTSSCCKSGARSRLRMPRPTRRYGWAASGRHGRTIMNRCSPHWKRRESVSSTDRTWIHTPFRDGMAVIRDVPSAAGLAHAGPDLALGNHVEDKGINASKRGVVSQAKRPKGGGASMALTKSAGWLPCTRHSRRDAAFDPLIVSGKRHRRPESIFKHGGDGQLNYSLCSKPNGSDNTREILAEDGPQAKCPPTMRATLQIFDMPRVFFVL